MLPLLALLSLLQLNAHHRLAFLELSLSILIPRGPAASFTPCFPACRLELLG